MSSENWTPLVDCSENNIDYKEQIGKGTFGEVWSAVWNGSEVAAKRIHEKYFKREYGQAIIDHYIGELRKEWEILRKLNHPNIVQMHTVLFPLNDSPVIVMELMHCDLLKFIESSTSSPKISRRKGISISLGIGKGLEYLHGGKPTVIHRDIAAKNILLTVDGHAKIADLGVATVFADDRDAFATARPGTPLYAAPETYKNIKGDIANYGVKADIFSFGVLLLVINIGYEPIYPGKDKAKVSEVKRRQNDIQQIENDRMKQLVIDCLQEKSSKRPNSSKIVKILQQIKDERDQKFKSDPSVNFEEVSPQLSPDHHFKVLLLGNKSVGKSCLFELLKNPVFKIAKTLKATVSINPGTHWFKYNASYVKMVLVDTSGEERYFAMSASYYRDIDGVILVYDVSDMQSFEKLPYWINNIKKYTTKDCIQMLFVGNKMDLRKNTKAEDMVSQEIALDFADQFEFPYVETSAKNIDSVMTMYKTMVGILISAANADADSQARLSESTIKLPSSPNQNKRFKDFICPSCKNS